MHTHTQTQTLLCLQFLVCVCVRSHNLAVHSVLVLQVSLSPPMTLTIQVDLGLLALGSHYQLCPVLEVLKAKGLWEKCQYILGCMSHAVGDLWAEPSHQ